MAKTRRTDNYIVTAVLIACVFVIAGFFGDYYYDLNDDVLIKDILSGSYTGVPEGHNIQMLYPISALISLFYRVARALPWYGIFLCVIQYGCFALIIKRTADALAFSEKGFWKKIIFLLFEAGIVLGLFLPHLVYVQYTVTCGLMSATAAFLILTKKDDENNMYVVPLILLLAAFCIRSEMLLLTLPMVLVAILMKYVLVCFEIDLGGMKSAEGSSYQEKRNYFIKYLNLCLGILSGILVCLAINKLAYLSPEWKEFTTLFKNRTELYDFQSIPDYNENKAFYDSIGMSESSQKLLLNYNFGLDESIDARMLGQIADYAATIRTDEKPMGTRIAEAARLYFYRLCYVSAPKGYEYPMTDFPWNIPVFILYVAAFIGCFGAFNWDMKKTVASLLLLVLLFACRTSLWMYIIVRGRDPIRITHPLYLLEILILAGMILALYCLRGSYSKDKEPFFDRVLLGFMCASTVAVFVGMPYESAVVDRELIRRTSSLTRYETLNEYMKERSDNYYLIDVYTSVSFATVTGNNEATYSEKMFGGVGNSGYNHDLLGGWASKSPLSVKKLHDRGYSSMEEALVSPGVYFVQNLDTDTDWLVDYYASKGKTVTVSQVDTVEEVFGIYSVYVSE